MRTSKTTALAFVAALIGGAALAQLAPPVGVTAGQASNSGETVNGNLQVNGNETVAQAVSWGGVADAGQTLIVGNGISFPSNTPYLQFTTGGPYFGLDNSAQVRLVNSNFSVGNGSVSVGGGQSGGGTTISTNNIGIANGGSYALFNGSQAAVSGTAGTNMVFGNVSAGLSTVIQANTFISLSPGLASWVYANTGLYQRQPVRTGIYALQTPADTAFTTVIGLPSPTLLNATAATADTSDTARPLIKYTTSAVSGNAVAVSGPFTTTQAGWLPMFSATFRTDASSIATQRIYCGMVKSSLDQVATLAAANTVNNAVLRYDAALDTDFMAETSDGTTASATDTTVAVAIGTTSVTGIDCTVAAECDFYIGGVRKVAKTTNIPSGTTQLGIECSITTETTTAHSLSLNMIEIQQH